MITSVAQQQLELFACATHELKRLSDTFRPIEALLSDAESRQAVEERVHDWLSRLKHVAYDIDDVLDEGKILGLGEEGDDEGDFINKVIQYLLSPCNFFDHVVSRYKVACRVKEIRERLDDIAADRNNYNFSSSAVKDGASSHRLTTPLIKKSEVMIGRENDREIMISSLMSRSSCQGAQVHVVAIVGIGGLGKTTLARQLYQDRRVQNHFNGALYWVCVSETFDVTRLTKEILEQVKGEGTSLTGLGSLQIELLKSLKGKRFLLVLDDVWNDDAEQWETLGASLNGEVHGSIILVTTRRDEVARTMNATYIHELEGLSEEDSLSLFRSTAFEGKEVMGYSVLANVERKIVNNCKGVPLSIKAIGSVMRSTNRTVEDWENVVNSKAWCEPQVMGKVLPPLLLSYTHLPSHLKQCFAYCSMFPKDWEFNKDMLVRLWVAEGFVRSEGNRETEDVGAEHFDQLVAWSMFQEVEDRSQGTVCKMHDLMHDLAEFVAKDDIYRFISIEGGKSEECPGRNVRHAFLSFTRTYDSSNKMPITLRGAKKLRTLYLCGVKDESHKAMVVDLFQQSRFLRAVVFEYSGIDRLPNAIGKMKHLRYLDLSCSDIEELPESVSHLRNLHTLNLNHCHELKKLPRGIGGMVSLRHLQNEVTDALEYLPKGLGRISGLRSLCKFIVGGGGEKGCRIDELQRLNSLHGILEIEHLERVSSQEEAEKAQLWNKLYLRRLVLSMSEGEDDDDAVTERMDNVLEGLRPHVNLEELELYEYRGSRLPSWMAVMRSLRKLEISNCQSLGSLPDSVGQLESLQYLQILSCPKLQSLPHSFGQLKALNHLNIFGCDALRSLPDSLGQLESLQHLGIARYGKLESLPHSFGQLKALNHLEIFGCNALRSLPDSLGQLESLQRLEISKCEKLESLPHSFGQLKALNGLEIRDCESLGSLPDGFQHLSLLQQLKIIDCPVLSERCKRDGGEDWPKISHIPDISIDSRRIQ